MSGRPRHHDLGVERTVLSCALFDNACIDLIELDAPEFYSGQHSVTWASVLRLHRAGASVDLTTLRAELARMGDLDRAGGDEALMALTESIPIVERVEEYAAIVRGHATVRRVLAATAQIQARAAEPIEGTEAFLDEAEATLSAVSSSRRVEAGMQSIADVMADVHVDLEKRERDGITGVCTGFSALDRTLGGIEPGQLVIVAGRPGSGKSAFAQAIALHAAQQGTPVGVFSLEMANVEWGRRFAMSRASVLGSRAKIGALTALDWQRLTQAQADLAKLPLWLQHAPGLTAYQLRSRARRMVARHGVGLIVIDYLQLMRWHERLKSREEEVEALSSTLKQIAGECRVPVVALAQLNRELEKRVDKRPVLSDLRNSGAIEQDADTVLFVYRDAMYHPEKADPRHAEIIIGKQRSGEVGSFRATWRAEYTRFEDADPGDFVDDQRTLGGDFEDPGVDYSSRRVGST